VTMTNSGGCSPAACEDFFAPPFDVFRLWSEDRRGFMNWIVASGRVPRFLFRIAQ